VKFNHRALFNYLVYPSTRFWPLSLSKNVILRR